MVIERYNDHNNHDNHHIHDHDNHENNNHDDDQIHDHFDDERPHLGGSGEGRACTVSSPTSRPRQT